MYKYSERVLVGFWFNKQQLEKEKRERLVEKRERGELPHQLEQRLRRSFTRPVSLSSSLVDCLKFGESVQLHCPEIEDLSYLFIDTHGCPDEERPQGPFQLGLVLAATCSPLEAGRLQRIKDGCPVSCTPDRRPYTRSVFVIRDPCCCVDRTGEWLGYGQEFSLELAKSKEPLYLRSETPLIDGQYGPNDHGPLRLQASRDGYAKWRVLHWNRHVRFETEAEPIQPCSRVVIQHVMTGKCLAAESRNWFKSLLGFECGASVHTYSDVHRNETSPCIWNMIVDKKVYKRKSKLKCDA